MGAGAGAEPSFQHHEVGGPASQQQRPEQHRVAEQHKGQQLPQHLEEVDGEGVRHGSPGSLGCLLLLEAQEQGESSQQGHPPAMGKKSCGQEGC